MGFGLAFHRKNRDKRSGPNETESQRPGTLRTLVRQNTRDETPFGRGRQFLGFISGDGLLQGPEALFGFLELDAELFHRRGNLPVGNIESPDESPAHPHFDLGIGQRPPSANKGETDIAPDAFGRDNLDETDLSRPADMGSAAGRIIEGLNFHDPDKPFDLGRPPQRHLGDFLGRDEIGFHRPILEDNLIRPALDPVQNLVRNLPDADLQGGGLRPQVKRLGLALDDFDKGLGQDVLAGVLLHVVQPPRPIDLPENRFSVHVPFEDMDDRPVIVQDLKDRDPVQGSQVPGLAARFGIKSRLVEDHRRPAFDRPPLGNPGFKLADPDVLEKQPPCFAHFDLPSHNSRKTTRIRKAAPITAPTGPISIL